MKRELNITIADMKSGNYETALTRFENKNTKPNALMLLEGLFLL